MIKAEKTEFWIERKKRKLKSEWEWRTAGNRRERRTEIRKGMKDYMLIE